MENSRKLKTSFWIAFGFGFVVLLYDYYVHFDERNNGPTMNTSTECIYPKWIELHSQCAHTNKTVGCIAGSWCVKQRNSPKKRAAWVETKSETADQKYLPSLDCAYVISASFGVVSTHSIAASHFWCARIARLCLSEHIYLSFFSFPFACLSLHSFRLRFERFSGSWWADEFMVPSANIWNWANTKRNISRKKSFTIFFYVRFENEWFFFSFCFVAFECTANAEQCHRRFSIATN